MENSNSKKNDIAPPQVGVPSYTKEQLEATHARLKRFVGPLPTNEIETRLLMNDNEALGLDPIAVTFPSANNRPILTEIPKPEGYKEGEVYTNTLMDPYYESCELEEALTKQDIGYATREMDTAKFCVQISHIERCYC